MKEILKQINKKLEIDEKIDANKYFRIETDEIDKWHGFILMNQKLL